MRDRVSTRVIRAKAAGRDDRPTLAELTRLSETDLDVLLDLAEREKGGGAFLAERGGAPVGALVASMRTEVWRIGALAGDAEAIETLLDAGVEASRVMGGEPPIAALIPAEAHGAIAALARRGALPRLPFLAIEAKRAPGGAADLAPEPLALSPALLSIFALWDGAVLSPRPLDHEILAKLAEGHVYRARGRIVGYAYVDSDGRIGPVAASDMIHLPAIVRHAARTAIERVGTARALVPGNAVGALDVLLGEAAGAVRGSFALATSRYTNAWDVALPWASPYV